MKLSLYNFMIVLYNVINEKLQFTKYNIELGVSLWKF